jgi:hypothetical protein
MSTFHCAKGTNGVRFPGASHSAKSARRHCPNALAENARPEKPISAFSHSAFSSLQRRFQPERKTPQSFGRASKKEFGLDHFQFHEDRITFPFHEIDARIRRGRWRRRERRGTDRELWQSGFVGMQCSAVLILHPEIPFGGTFPNRVRWERLSLRDPTGNPCGHSSARAKMD